MQLQIAGFLNVRKASIAFDFSSNETLPESAKWAEVVGHVNSSTGEVVHASSSSTSVDHASTNHEGMSEAYDVKSAGNDEGFSHSHSPKKKRKKRGKTEKSCETCTQGRKTTTCREDCGGRETLGECARWLDVNDLRKKTASVTTSSAGGRGGRYARWMDVSERRIKTGCAATNNARERFVFECGRRACSRARGDAISVPRAVARMGPENPGRWDGVGDTEEVLDVLRKGARMMQ